MGFRRSFMAFEGSFKTLRGYYGFRGLLLDLKASGCSELHKVGLGGAPSRLYL